MLYSSLLEDKREIGGPILDSDSRLAHGDLPRSLRFARGYWDTGILV